MVKPTQTAGSYWRAGGSKFASLNTEVSADYASDFSDLSHYHASTRQTANLLFVIGEICVIGGYKLTSVGQFPRKSAIIRRFGKRLWWALECPGSTPVTNWFVSEHSAASAGRHILAIFSRNQKGFFLKWNYR